MGNADLMGTAEVAKALGVTRQRVLQLLDHADFPQPIAVLSMGKVWNGSDIRAWARTYKPRRGQP